MYFEKLHYVNLIHDYVTYILKNVIYMLQLRYGRNWFILKNNVKTFRVQADLTQHQLAEKVGVTRQTISLIEKGKYNPTLKLCLEICYVVNRTLDEIFWIDQEENK
jgi:putative transcriptional regulator